MRHISLYTACAIGLAPVSAGAQATEAPTTEEETPQLSEEQRAAQLLQQALSNLAGLRDNPAKDATLFEFSYGEPGSPVLPLIGVEADQIARVESIRKFGLSLLAGSEAAGTGPAIGIDFSPYWLLAPRAVSLEDYKNLGAAERIFARTKFAAAASEGDASKSTPSSIVVSLSSNLLRGQDPLNAREFTSCTAENGYNSLIRQVINAPEQAHVTDPMKARQIRLAALTAKLAELKPAIDAAYQICVDRLARAMVRRPALDFGAGVRFSGRPGKLRNLDDSGTIIWATYSTGSLGADTDERHASPMRRSLGGLQVRGVLHGRYTFRERFYDAAGSVTGRADSAMIVAGLETVPAADNSDRFRWNLQAGWNKQDSPNGTDPDKNYWRYLGIARLRVTKGIWLNGTFGRVSGRGVQSDTYFTFGISFAPSGGNSPIGDFYAGRASR